MFDRIGQSPHLLYIIVLPLAEKANSKPVECVQVLSSERKAIGNTWQSPVKSMEKENEHHSDYSVRRQETCFAKVVRNAPGSKDSKDGLLGKFPERTQTVIFFAAI